MNTCNHIHNKVNKKKVKWIVYEIKVPRATNYTCRQIMNMSNVPGCSMIIKNKLLNKQHSTFAVNNVRTFVIMYRCAIFNVCISVFQIFHPNDN